MSKLGTFIWHDLMTTDLAASKHFYTKLFDWKLKEHPEYTELATAQGRDQGGMMAQDPSRGIPSHWIGYVQVENVDKTTARATEIGGKVLAPPMEIPNVGRFSVVQDPTGAAFMPFVYTGEHAQKVEEKQDESVPAPGRFCWDELLTTDPKKATAFYTALFGWEVTAMDMGGGMTYWMARKDGADVGGIMQSPPNAPHPPMWLSYVAVKDVDAKTKQAQELGGRVYAGPMDIPNVGRFAVLGDPTGATIALFRSNKW